MRRCACGHGADGDEIYCRSCGLRLPVLPDTHVRDGLGIATEAINAAQVAIPGIDQTAASTGPVSQSVTVNVVAPTDSRGERYREFFERKVRKLGKPPRNWFPANDRKDLDTAASEAGLSESQRVRIEEEVQAHLGRRVREHPLELWGVTIAGGTDSHDLERDEVVASLAEYLDAHDPKALFASRYPMRGQGAWIPMTEVPGLFEECLARRRMRYERILLDAARHDRLASARHDLDASARFLTAHDLQVARRNVEQQLGRPVSRSDAEHPRPSDRAREPSLEGLHESCKSPSVRLEIARDRLDLRNTNPIRRSGSARIARCERDGTRFRLRLEGATGDFGPLALVDGELTPDGLKLTRLDGGVGALTKIFECAFRKL